MTAYYSREREREQERTVILEKLHFSWELLLKPFIFFSGRKDYWSNHLDCRINTAHI